MTDNITEIYTNWFREYPWQVHITTGIPPTIQQNEAHEALIRDVLRPLTRHLHTRIASISVVKTRTKTEQAHIHTLAFGDKVNLFAYLLEIDDYLAKNKTELNSHKDAIMVKCYVTDLQSRYLAKNYTDTADLFFYDRKLLEKTRCDYRQTTVQTCPGSHNLQQTHTLPLPK